MGVSLERVQFKFASIVGELCNEPDVLSQFAVWLDLRLAEYKLKGAISLDCSGEEPEASWMKGLKKCKRCETDKQTNKHDPMSSRRNASDKPYPSMSPGSDSPDFSIIKSEPQEIFPLELHENSTMTCSVSRKRPSSDGQWLNNSDTNLSKRQFLSPSNSSANNQSLFSVIGDLHGVGDTAVSDANKQNDDVILSSEQFLLESNNSGTSGQGTSVDPNISWSSQQGTSLDSDVNSSKDDKTSDSTAANVKDQTFVCTACRSIFSQEMDLYRHQQQHHQLLHHRAPFRCNVCGTRFTLKNNLRRHERKHVPVSLSKHFKCRDCGRIFFRPDVYKSHINSKHGRDPSYEPSPPPTERTDENTTEEVKSESVATMNPIST